MKTGQGILSCDLLDREVNCSLPPKVNGKCVYKGIFRRKCLIYKVKIYLCDAMYIGNTQYTSRKRMDGHFSDVQLLLKNGQNHISCSLQTTH